MIKKLRRLVELLFSNKIYKDISVMLSGSMLAQVIMIGVTPILTRIYTVEDFGNLSIFMSFVAILASGTTGKYELAISIPKDDRDGASLLQGTVIINHIVGLVIGLILLIFSETISGTLGMQGIEEIILLVPICILIAAYTTVLNHWFLRHRKYSIPSTAAIFTAIILGTLNLIFGYTDIIRNGLIYAYLFAQLLTVGFYLFFLFRTRLQKDILEKFDKKRIYGMFSKYSNFPKFQLPSDLLGSVSARIMPIILMIFFSSSVVGLFAMATRIVKIPLGILANAISLTFKNEALDLLRENKSCEQLFIQLLKRLISISLIPYLLIIVFGPWLFQLLLGEEWFDAGVYARILAGGLYFELLALSFKSVLQITNKQSIYLYLQIINLVLITLSVGLGYYVFNSAKFTIAFYSLGNGITYLIMLLYIYTLVKRNRTGVPISVLS